ncbi:fumarylacetoacetase [Aquabacterium sp. J223]|uniref:fumarylacetoacetase n=1 Tax=Aquabacterium sp. J223 TaxID=2898431 RepID=UPI0021AD8724|nr:fumarylacetoacetase [Aquabacterium sp. J223]UUX94990.1 fumarylacetoacetase [Aquabacterium sp. J223]
MTRPDLNATHDPRRGAWLASAAPGGDFPLQNLPLGLFRERPADRPRPGVAIGDRVVDLQAVDAAGLLGGLAAAAVRSVDGHLNGLMALGHAPASALRARLSDLLRADGADTGLRDRAEHLLRPMDGVEMVLPVAIGDYTDFLTSFHHTARHGRFKGLKDPVPPVFHSLPVAYHGRASSIRVSGTPLRRPRGQWRDADSGAVRHGPVEALDFELELAAFVGPGNTLGQPIALDDAPAQLFGYVLLNDWSSKGVQWWEQMLGPFLGKSFMSTVSPWVVTAEALWPFACEAPARPAEAPPLLPYLHSARDRAAGGLDLHLEAWFSSERMRRAGRPPLRLAATHLSHLSWTFAQMLTHHASNGCDLRPGDLIGSGTVSGEADESRACLTEITSAGREPLRLPDGDERLWLQDGDEIELRARAQRDGAVPIGFGACSGRILPALAGDLA